MQYRLAEQSAKLQNNIKMMVNKEFVTKNKSFTWLGYLLIGAGIVLPVSTYTSINPTKTIIESNLMFGIIVIVFGVCCLLLGRKKRIIRFTHDKLEYESNKITFSAPYSEIALIKTFHDPANRSDNLLVMKDEQTQNIICWTNSFFSAETLHNVFAELVQRCKTGIDSEDTTVDNELEWNI